MEEERIVHLLHELPRERALGGFTAQVMRRLDEQAPPRRGAQMNRLHRLMVAAATVAAVGVSVGLLQREHSPGPLAVASVPVGAKLAASLPASPPRQLSRLSLGPRPAASRSASYLDPAQAHEMLRELRLEQARLERELRNLRRPSNRGYATPPTVLYLGGDENVDLVLNIGRARALQMAPSAERDDGENNNFLD